MIQIYTCPVCGGQQRILVDKDGKPISKTRCLHNGCKSYTPEKVSEEQHLESLELYEKLVGKKYNMRPDGQDKSWEVVVDVQSDKSVILVDRIEYLPLRLTEKQFRLYE
jgi:hypothetical protein